VIDENWSLRSIRVLIFCGTELTKV
jgi:hypothetical protein